MNKSLLLFLLLALAVPLRAQVEALERQLVDMPRDTQRVNVLNRLARLHYNTAPERTRYFAARARKLADSLHYTRGLAEAYKNESLLLRLKGENTRELEMLLRALQLFQSLNDSLSIAQTYTDMGAAHHQEGDFKAARDQYMKALDLQRAFHNKEGIALTLRKIGVLEVDMKNYAQGLEAFELALKLERESNNAEGIANLLNNIGVAYYEMGEYGKALQHYESSLALFRETNNLNRLPAAYHNQARVYLAQGNVAQALQLASLGLPIAEQTDNRMALLESYQLHTDIYAARHDYEKAFDYQQRSEALKDSLAGARSRIRYAQLKTLIETERKEQEIDFLKQERVWTVFRQKIAYAGLALALFVGGVVIYYQRHTIRTKKELLKKNDQVHAARQALLTLELENKKLVEGQLQRDLEFRHKELLTYTLNLVQKNTIMENLREGIHELLSTSDKNSKAKISKLIKVIDYSLETEKDWDEFKMYFEKVHSSFFERLKQQYPDLSQGDLKLCSLIGLNLSMKEMAELMGISPESVKMARHRLRKKLNMPTEENLADFVASFKSS
jgi:DNA-binding CsgD family transcriptional regulator